MGYGEKVGTLYFDKGIIYYIKLCLYNNFNNFIYKFKSKPGEMEGRREKKFQDSIFFFEKGHEKVVHYYF